MGKRSRTKLLSALLICVFSSLTLAFDDSVDQIVRVRKDRQLRRKRGRDQFYAYGYDDKYDDESAGSVMGKSGESKSSKRGKGKGGSKSKKTSKSKSSSSKSRESEDRKGAFLPTRSPIEVPEIPSMGLEVGHTESPMFYPTDLPTSAVTKIPTAAPTRVTTGTPTTAPTKSSIGIQTLAPTNSIEESPTRTPTISPTLIPTLAGSSWPSIQPSVQLQRVTVTDYYISYVIPGLTEEPSQEDIDILLDATRQFFVTIFEDYYVDSDVQFLDLKYELKEWLYNASIPEERFNLYMHYDTVVLYELDSPRPASPLESFSIMSNTDFAPYIIEYVRTIPGFITAEEIDFRAVRTFDTASREDKLKSVSASEQLFTTNVFCRSKKRALPFCK